MWIVCLFQNWIHRNSYRLIPRTYFGNVGFRREFETMIYKSDFTFLTKSLNKLTNELIIVFCYYRTRTTDVTHWLRVALRENYIFVPKIETKLKTFSPLKSISSKIFELDAPLSVFRKYTHTYMWNKLNNGDDSHSLCVSLCYYTHYSFSLECSCHHISQFLDVFRRVMQTVFSKDLHHHLFAVKSIFLANYKSELYVLLYS